VTLLFVVAANLPDADFLLLLLGSETYLLWHRGLTHSVLGLLIFPPALAVLASGLIRGLSLRRAILVCEVAALSHVALDLPTSWGTLALYPWSNRRMALDWIFIVDPLIWVVLLAGILLGMRKPEHFRRRAASAALTLVGLYIAGAGALHASAVERVREVAAERERGKVARLNEPSSLPATPAQRARPRSDPRSFDEPTADDVEVYPLPFSPLHWHGVCWTGDSLVHVLLTGIPPRAEQIWREPHHLGVAAVRTALLTPAGQAFLWWARAPAAEVRRKKGDRTVVGLADRRFLVRGRDVFGLEIAVGPDGAYRGASWEGDSVFSSRP
jgi:membrane-bound metal-dependent hydrolase YbcI (DUF457 family)